MAFKKGSSKLARELVIVGGFDRQNYTNLTTNNGNQSNFLAAQGDATLVGLGAAGSFVSGRRST